MTTTASPSTITASPPDPHAAPPRLRRRPAVLGLGVVLVAAGGLTAAWLATSTGNTTAVVVAAQPVLRGQVLTSEQLSTAQVSGLPARVLTPARDLVSLVGKTVVTDVPVGSPVPPSAVSADPLPGPGFTVVGILLPAGQLPGVELLPGARVRIVTTPRSQEDVPPNIAAGTEAVLVSTSVDSNSGNTVVSVSVPAPQAAALAALATTGRAALVLDADEAGS